MPSFVQFMVGLGGTALIVGILTVWLHDPGQPSSLSTDFTSSPRTRMVGNSALSHGGPSSNSRMSAPGSPVFQFQLGQKLIVAMADHVSEVRLLPRPGSATSSFSSASETRSVLPGTIVFVSGMPTVEPVPTQSEQYYEVTLPDGTKGRLPERALRPATSGD